MDAIVIRGNGPLKGVTHASGAKNAALPILASSLLAHGEHTFRNVPNLADVKTMLQVLDTMGCQTQRLTGKKSDVVTINGMTYCVMSTEIEHPSAWVSNVILP